LQKRNKFVSVTQSIEFHVLETAAAAAGKKGKVLRVVDVQRRHVSAVVWARMVARHHCALTLDVSALWAYVHFLFLFEISFALTTFMTTSPTKNQ
jgi:hypothetical protein